jgi:hypothetical protein
MAPIPEPPLGKVVATIDGQPWHSTLLAIASPPLFDPKGPLTVLGFSESIQINVGLPTRHPSIGTCRLAADSAVGIYTVLTAGGWIARSTDASHIGYATVTRVDSLTIAGTFYFDAFGSRVFRIRGGAFNVPIRSITSQTTQSRGMRDRPGNGDGAGPRAVSR